MKNARLLLFFLASLLGLFSCEKAEETKAPNIIIFYVDDLGYADLGCYGAKGVTTPNVDRLASNGVRFTDAHSTAATCTPSRYSLLTGSYAFRNDASILPGDAPLIIDTNGETIASAAKANGYSTAVIGKWHLGLGKGAIDWNKRISPGPAEVGFDYSFLIPATGDRVPCVYLENQQVVGLDPEDPITVDYNKKIEGLPVGSENPELLKVKADAQHNNTIVNGISRIGFMSGGSSAHWVDEEFPDVLVQKAQNFIENHKDSSFFLFFSFHDIHVPRIPHPRFVGKSEMGPRGDAIVQMDWTVGQIISQLEKLGLDKNTLVIFTSDNGPVLDDGYMDQAKELIGDHDPAGSFRGGKYSAFEAGTRVPTITYWPGRIKPLKSDAMISQVDLFTSLGKLMGPASPKGNPDSEDILKELLGESTTGKTYMIEESFDLALRKENWKYIRPKPGAVAYLESKDMETGMSETDQLYNLSDDPGETKNVAEQYPEITAELKKKLEEMVNR
ncbi:sulfatase-like hydrolase/transferase [Fulvivirga sp. M361]|uniref:sulfatase-like hydrolase/transferase n=1 Tax=Fulvivirga sp. M361 TaxID=2594266 RepID=UPI001179EE82|nr:sulfatase-like hydrolase/transferase [Fulvivirga sp. M361]TRX62025.1 sulfatase-like hydrolase/transferase [Fulvivirga sp. M361]